NAKTRNSQRVRRPSSRRCRRPRAVHRPVWEYVQSRARIAPAVVRERLSKELGYVTPKVGADAAIFNAMGELLLVLRADDHCWCLPCGWVQPYESPAEAAVREAREETGLTVKPIQLVNVFYRAAGSYKGTHALIAVVYLCERIDGTITLSHEHLD